MAHPAGPSNGEEEYIKKNKLNKGVANNLRRLESNRRTGRVNEPPKGLSGFFKRDDFTKAVKHQGELHKKKKEETKDEEIMSSQSKLRRNVSKY